jgi:hypothetical protein
MSRRAHDVFALLLLALAGCEEVVGVPAKPTWVDDVEPILRGNCFHCHGSSSSMTTVGTRRWDFAVEHNDPNLTAIGDFSVLYGTTPAMPLAPAVSLISDDMESGKNQVTFLLLFAGSKDLAMRMPPPPATPLSARELKVLENWQNSGRERGMRSPNAKPTAAWLNKGQNLFLVSDADREQVLGKISCSGRDELLIRSGAHSLPDGTSPPCTVTLYDGQETNTVQLN